MLLVLFLFSLAFAYDKDISKHYVDLCQSSYCVSDIDQWTCDTCDNSFKLDYIVENSGARAIQGYDSITKTIFTAFRGSSNIQNWLDNIKISKISPYNDSSISVEKGFYNSYSKIKTDLVNNLHILTNKYNINTLSITGHSLGAAEAILFAYDILNLYNYKIAYLYTYGSPRVGNDVFVQSFTAYNIPYYRVTHHYDIVPHVPEEFLDYLHIPNEIWYSEDNSNYKICDDTYYSEDDNCSNSCSPTHCTSSSDHLYYLNVTMGNDPC